VEDEVGDLFFVLVNIARYLSVDADQLYADHRKFRRRFGWLEEQLLKQGRSLEAASLDEMEALWQQAKTREVAKSERDCARTEQIIIRKCESIDEFKACVSLQKEVWNFDDATWFPCVCSS